MDARLLGEGEEGWRGGGGDDLPPRCAEMQAEMQAEMHAEVHA